MSAFNRKTVLTLFLVGVVLLSGCVEARLNYKWVGGNEIKSGGTAELMVWVKNKGTKPIKPKLLVMPEDPDVVKVFYNGEAITSIDFDEINPKEETAHRILTVKGDTTTSSQEVEINLVLYVDEEYVTTETPLIKISK